MFEHRNPKKCPKCIMVEASARKKSKTDLIPKTVVVRRKHGYIGVPSVSTNNPLFNVYFLPTPRPHPSAFSSIVPKYPPVIHSKCF